MPDRAGGAPTRSRPPPRVVQSRPMTAGLQLVAEVPARPAATVLLLRDGGQGLEVHLQQRRAEMDFGALAYVFPGGSLDAQDSSAEAVALLEGDLGAAAQRMELDGDEASRRLCAG